MKNTHVTERVVVEFRSEFFNILNHPNFTNPGRTCTSGDSFMAGGQNYPAGTCFPNASFGTITDTNPASPSFGKAIPPTTFGAITATRNPAGDFGSSRQIQFALKLKF